MSTLPNGLAAHPMASLENRHQNFVHPLTASACFRLTIPDVPALPNGQVDVYTMYQQTTANFQWLIAYGIAQQVRLRALGSNWSFTKVGYPEGGIIDTTALQLSFGLQPAMVAEAYQQAGHRADNLWFTQCGSSIIGLEQKLEARGKSLRASGASNGQTIAGATSTGTHGAAFGVGAVHDTVVGLHLVCGPDRHVWLERASYPVASPALTDWLGVTEVLRDDALFNAAVVSFGSFGFLHGLLLEVEDKFLLEDYSAKRVPYDAGLQRAMTQQDFSSLTQVLHLPPVTPTHYPWHFQLIVNVHQIDLVGADPDQAPYVRIYYHTPYQAAYPRHQPPTQGYTYGDDTMGIIKVVLDTLGSAVPQLVPSLINRLYPLALDDTNGTAGTMSETFGNTNIRGKAASAAIGVAAADSPRVLSELAALNKQHPFPGLAALRFVKGTQATLGFTRWPVTCVLELDGIQSTMNLDFLQRFWDQLEAAGIAYTLHWGKINFNLTPSRLRRMYGDAAVDSWMQARARLLDGPTRAVFTNHFMEDCGLMAAPDAPVA